MFREIRRKKNEISIEEAKQLLKNNKRAALSVNGDGGYPYTIPIDFYYDEKEDRIYFHSSKVGHKIDAIKNNDKVCFTTWDDGYQVEGDWAYYVSSCVVFGHATLITDPILAEIKLRAFANKYYPSPDEVEIEIKKAGKAVQMIQIDIDHISGKRIHEK